MKKIYLDTEGSFRFREWAADRNNKSIFVDARCSNCQVPMKVIRGESNSGKVCTVCWYEALELTIINSKKKDDKVDWRKDGF